MPNRTTVPETSAWVNSIYLLEINDLAKGYDPITDDIGISNLQAQQLGNRTKFLKDLFLTAHSSTGVHTLRDSDFADDAAIKESKLNLAFSTDYINSILTANENLSNTVKARVTAVTGTEQGSAADSLAKAVKLSWQYADHGYAFEMFNSDIVLRDLNEVALTSSIIGDNSIDVDEAGFLSVGNSYVIHNGNGTGSEFITVSQILSGTRVVCEQNITNTRTSGVVSSTSWIVNNDATATARNGGIYVSSQIDVCANHNDSKIIIRRQNNAATFRVRYKLNGSSTWSFAVLSGTSQLTLETRDEEYKAPGGVFELRIDVTCPSSTPSCKIYHICVFPNVDTASNDLVRTPKNVLPANEALNVGVTPTLEGSEYYSLYGVAQAAAQFQISTTDDFLDIVYDNTVNSAVTSKVIPGSTLLVNTTYFWRCRYKDADGYYSLWSKPTGFATSASYSFIATPGLIAPANKQTNLNNLDVFLISTPFRVTNTEDTHVSTQWQISTSSNFSSILHDTGESTTDLTQHLAPANLFATNTKYFWRCRHKGTTLGFSPWASAEFTTRATFSQVVGVALVNTGGIGGTWVRIDSTGNLASFDQAYFNSHPVFSGIVPITIGGQQMIKIPKFYYKVGVLSSGPYVNKPFWMISNQQLEGYKIHPAFMKNGAEIPAIHVGKYQASVSSGKLGSIANVDPTIGRSLVQFNADASSRNTASVNGFMVWSIYHLGAIQMLYLIENATFDSQTKTAMGRVSSTSLVAVDDNSVAIAEYRGITGLWGNIGQWVDGLKLADGRIYVWDSLGHHNYLDTGEMRPASSVLYPETFNDTAGIDFDFGAVFIRKTGQSLHINSTCPDEQEWGSNNSIPFMGGSWDSETAGGLWYLNNLYTDTVGVANVGTRLAKI